MSWAISPFQIPRSSELQRISACENRLIIKPSFGSSRCDPPKSILYTNVDQNGMVTTRGSERDRNDCCLNWASRGDDLHGIYLRSPCAKMHNSPKENQNVTYFGEYIILTKLRFVIRRPSSLWQNYLLVPRGPVASSWTWTQMGPLKIPDRPLTKS